MISKWVKKFVYHARKNHATIEAVYWAVKVRVYFLKGKPDSLSELEETESLQKWMLANLYDVVWEAEFKNLVTPDIIAMRFRVEAEPFGVPLRKKLPHPDIVAGDIIHIGPSYYLVLPKGFKELQI